VLNFILRLALCQKTEIILECLKAKEAGLK